MTNDVDGSQKIIKTPEISDFLAKPWQQIFDFRVGWIYLPGHLGPRFAGLPMFKLLPHNQFEYILGDS